MKQSTKQLRQPRTQIKKSPGLLTKAWIEAQSSAVREAEMERLRLMGLAGSLSAKAFAARHRANQQAAQARSRTLRGLLAKSQRECAKAYKSAGIRLDHPGLFTPSLCSSMPSMRSWMSESIWVYNYRRDDHVFQFQAPSKIVLIGSGITQMPDTARWSAHFANSAADLVLVYDFSVPNIRREDTELIDGSFSVQRTSGEGKRAPRSSRAM